MFVLPIAKAWEPLFSLGAEESEASDTSTFFQCLEADFGGSMFIGASFISESKR
jgi:hypothetical protein